MPEAQAAVDVAGDDGVQGGVLHLLGRQLAALPIGHGHLRYSSGTMAAQQPSLAVRKAAELNWMYCSAALAVCSSPSEHTAKGLGRRGAAEVA